MEKTINPIKQYIFSFFAMIITLVSFILLSLQITFISILWGFSRFVNYFNHKLADHEAGNNL